MKSINKYITEKAGDSGKWVAIEITTAADGIHDKDKTSQRVISLDTYYDMKEKGYTKGQMTIKYLNKISPVCNSKEAAMSYLDVPQKKSRVSKIDKNGADYIVWCINCGKMNAAGNTKWDWNIWDEKDSEIYMGDYGRSFLFGAAGSLKRGDTLFCVDNDTQKKLTGAPKKVEAVCKCDIEDFRKVYRETYSTCCKPPKRAFGKVSDGLPWTNRMGQFYSIKGVAKEA